MSFTKAGRGILKLISTIRFLILHSVFLINFLQPRFDDMYIPFSN